MRIPKHLLRRVDEVIGFIGDTTQNYLKVKMQIINNFPNSGRNLFSRRHSSTKKHKLNEFDRAIITYWKSKTGIKLEVEPTMLHDPDWEHRKKGWGLVLFNEERRKRQHAQQNQQ